jgi:hypothetical protein
MKKIVLVFGLLAGLIVCTTMSIFMAICYKDPASSMGTGSMVIGFLSMIIAFSLIYVGVKNYRDKHLDGTISFGKAFKVGLLIALVASTLYVITWAIMYTYVVPDFMDIYSSQMIKQAGQESAAAAQAKADEMAKYKEMYKNPLFFVLFTYMEILPVGLLISLITALILKRKRIEPVMA